MAAPNTVALVQRRVSETHEQIQDARAGTGRQGRPYRSSVMGLTVGTDPKTGSIGATTAYPASSTR
jgi:hypothetical protein